jgi:hypothetical protein
MIKNGKSIHGNIRINENIKHALPWLLVFLFVLAIPFGFSCNAASTADNTSDNISAVSRDKGTVTRYDEGYRFDENGWIYIHIEGEPYQRGFQHGYLVAPELKEILKSLEYLTYWETGMKWDFFVDAAEQLFVQYLDDEYSEEMKGIADGAREAGTDISWQEVLAWNGYEELTGYWWPNVMEKTYESLDNDHCSAFIATGSATVDGSIVMAHTSWDAYEWGQFFNVIMDLKPSSGHRIFMQSVPGYIESMTDFFVTDAGIIGTETTIAGFGRYDADEVPEFLRVRKAMQYADTLDEFTELMKKQNDGGYANSWLLADVDTGEIMLFELGLKYSYIERKTDGYFIGFNAPQDPRIRNIECGDTGYSDIRTAMGARRVRLTQLMEEYHGKLDIEAGKRIMADRYDVYLKAENPCSRTVEGHYELDPFQFWPARQPYKPAGAVDGKVVNSNLAREMSFWARFGNSSGMPFYADRYFHEHPQWNYLDGYLRDRSTQPWTLFNMGQIEGN